MLKLLIYLTNRPIAVYVVLVGLTIIGLLSIIHIPVSLIPSIEIPHIKVCSEYRNMDAIQMEKAITGPLRNEFISLNGLKDIQSKTEGEWACIELEFDYGHDLEKSYHELNEKIDLLSLSLPGDMDRPRVISARSGDLPVFYINIVPVNEGDEVHFIEISRLCEEVISRKLEQLKSVAMVDVTGTSQSEIEILVDPDVLLSAGISLADIEGVIQQNNAVASGITVQQGYYRYRLKFPSLVNSRNDLLNIPIRINERIIHLKDLVSISRIPSADNGYFFSGDKRGISMAVLTTEISRYKEVRSEVEKVLDELNQQYPDLEFELVRDQSSLLISSINNMQQSLVLGIILGFFILLIFINDLRASLILILSVPITLLITISLLYLLGISINILSIGGLILTVGMMVDNSIIVLDSIWFQRRFQDADRAVIIGSKNVVAPLLGAALTNCVVLIPLVTMSGLTKILFYEQALTIGIGISVSFVFAVTVLPVLVKSFQQTGSDPIKHITPIRVLKSYEWGYRMVLRNKKIVLFFIILIVSLGYYVYKMLPWRVLPAIEQDDITLKIDWNENISAQENAKRCKMIYEHSKNEINSLQIYSGSQRFRLINGYPVSNSGSLIHGTLNHQVSFARQKDELLRFIHSNYPQALAQFEHSSNDFEKVFSKQLSALSDIRIYPVGHVNKLNINKIDSFITAVEDQYDIRVNNLQKSTFISCTIDHYKLLQYKVEYNELLIKLKQGFGDYSMGSILTDGSYVPLRLSFGINNPYQLLKNIRVQNRDGIAVAVSEFIKLEFQDQFKSIHADDKGIYAPMNLQEGTPGYNLLRKEIEHGNLTLPGYNILSVNDPEENKDLQRLIKVLIIAILLLFFILTIQFQSFLIPLIILIEIPIDISASLLILYLFGYQIDMMSLIGIIIMIGVILNDSILKIDSILKVKQESNLSVHEAIFTGSKQKLNSILMTSLTTMLALLPLLFQSDLGAQLQIPMALSILGGLSLGTIVSLFFIPLALDFIFTIQIPERPAN